MVHTFIGKDSHFTGIKKTLENAADEIHAILWKRGTGELYYVKASFSAITSNAVKISSDFADARETFFVGTSIETVGSETNVFQSYTVGWAP